MRMLGIIAGAGELPKQVIEACDALRRPYVVVALKGFACPDLLPCDKKKIHWVRLGAMGSTCRLLHQKGVQELVLIGAVRRPSLSSLRPDWRGVKFLAKAGLKSLGDDGLLKAIISEIEREGFTVIGADALLTDVVARRGVYGKVKPTKQHHLDILKGFEVAQVLGAADVGQSVIVADGLVLGVEAIEGTDALMARCKDLPRSQVKGVLVKVKKPHQERRVDLPTIGVQTIENAAKYGLSGIAVEAGSAFVVNEQAVVEKANQLGLFLVGVDAQCLNK